MDLRQSRAQVHPGNGLVIRAGGAIVVAWPGDQAQEAFVERLGTAVASAAGRPLAEVQRLLADVGPDAPPLAAVASDGDTTTAVIAGPAEVVATTPAGSQRLGSDPAAAGERPLPADATALALVPAGEEPPTELKGDLRAGIVVGRGVTLTPGAASAYDLAPAVQTPAVQTPAVQTLAPQTPAVETPAAPTPAQAPAAEVQQTPAAAPSVGVLVLDNRVTYALERGFVLGREPDNDGRVQDGSLRPLVLGEGDLTVSRVHARVEVQGATLTVVDVHSANGTALAGPDDADFAPLAADQPATLLPGARLRVGSHTLAFAVPAEQPGSAIAG